MNSPEFDKAAALSKAKKYEEALPLYQALVQQWSREEIETQPNLLYTCLISLGECYSELEQYDAAIPVLEKALQLGRELGKDDIFVPQSELAWLYNETGNREKALRFYREALEIADEEEAYYIYIHLGEIFLHEDFPEAIRSWENALELVAKEDDHEKIFIALEKLLTHLEARQLIHQAIEIGRSGIELLKDTPFIVDLRSQLAAVFESAGLTEEATLQLDILEEELERGPTDWESETWWFRMRAMQLRGNIHLRTEGVQPAENFFRKALEMARINDPRAEASITYDIGVCLLSLEHYQTAAKYLKKALKVAVQIDYSLLERSAQGQLAALYYNIGKYHEAITLYEKLLPEEREAEDWSSYVVSINNLAAVYRQIGEIKKAQSLFEETGRLAAKLGPMDQVFFLRNTAAVTSFWGDHEKALGLFFEALSLAQKDKLDHEIPFIKEDIGLTYYALGHFEKALAQLKPLEKENAFLYYPSNQLSLYNLLGIIHDEMDDLERAEFYLFKARKVAEENDLNFSLPTVYNNLGVAYLKAEKYDQAGPLLLKALALDRELNQMSQLSTDHHNVGLFYHDQQDFSKALSHFEEAIRLKEFLRDQGEDEQRIVYLNQEYNSYELLIDTLVKLDRKEQALSTLERYKNRELLGKMKAQMKDGALTFNQVRASLPEDTALIVLTNVGTKDLLAFAFSRNTAQTAIIPLETHFGGDFPGAQQYRRESKAPKVDVFKDKWIENKLPDAAVQRMPSGPELAEQLKFLIQYYRQRICRDPRLCTERKMIKDREIGLFFYRLFFSNFEEILQHCRQIILVPDDLLGLLPFDTLINEKGDFLAETHYLRCIPSIRVYQHLLEKPAPANGGKVFAMGIADYQGRNSHLPETSDWTVRNLTDLKQQADTGQNRLLLYQQLGLTQWQNLPFAEAEVELIRTTWPKKTELLKGEALTTEALKALSTENELSDYDIFHFATHAITLPALPELSALVLHPSRNEVDPFFTFSEIEKLKINADLTVLSACETALGKFYGGDGAASLTIAFLVAGSRRVIATLWPAHDKHTMLFINEFYQLLREHSFETALGLTKRKCIRGALGADLQQPKYWGAFVLWGQGSQKLSNEI